MRGLRQVGDASYVQGVEMGASTFVGRVGGLAVALGVGVAIATGQGVASASPDEGGASAPADTNSPPASNATSASSATDATTPKPPVTSTSTSTAPELGQAGSGQVDTSVSGASEAGAEDDDVSVDDPKPITRPAHKSTRPSTDESGVEKKSPDGLSKKKKSSADEFAGPLPTTAAAVETATATGVADTLTTGAPAAAVHRAVVAIAPTATVSSSSTTAAPQAAFVAMAAPAPATQRFTLVHMVTQLLSAFANALASNLPGSPSWSPLGLALLALGARRETEQMFSASATTTTSATPVAALALITPTATVATEPATTRTPVTMSINTQFIEFVTGPGNLNDTQRRFGIGGTDLGIMWDNGIADDPTTVVNEHQVLIAFGDTFSNSYPVRSGIWRMNTLFRSSDTTLSNGLYVPAGIQNDPGKYSGSPMTDPNFSREVLGGPPYTVGPQVTIIPTAAISVPGAGPDGGTRQYMNFMSVRSWDSPGHWTTNYSGIAYSDDNGQNWRAELVPASSIRTAAAGRSTVPYVSGNQNFQQGAFVTPPAGSPEAAEGWVYSYGTPSGRSGTVYLSRVNQFQILDQTKYQYWDGSKWVANNPAAAKPILPGTTSSFFGFFKSTTYPSAGEMSVQYNPYLKKYVMLYADKNNNVVMRTSTTPQGTWSAPTTLVTSTKLPGLYAPMIHPWSGTTNLPEADRQYLYWNVSTWNDYEVRLMRTDLTKV
jgi:hypothetical protein